MGSLFAVTPREVSIGMVMATHITKDNLPSLFPYYQNVKSFTKLGAYGTIGLLLMGGNNYYKVVDDYLFLYHYNLSKLSLVTMPFNINTGKLMPLKDVYRHMKENDVYRIRAVSETLIKNYEIAKKYFDINKGVFGNEYVYSTEKLAKLEGKDFAKYRNKINKFVKEFGGEWKYCSSDNREETLEAYRHWCANEGQKYHSIADKNYFADMLELYERNNIMFYDKEGKPLGFVGYVILNDTWAYGTFRKIDSSYPHLAQYAEHVLCKVLYEQGIMLLNDGQDDSLAGLKELKMGFRPVEVFKSVEFKIKR